MTISFSKRLSAVALFSVCLSGCGLFSPTSTPAQKPVMPAIERAQSIVLDYTVLHDDLALGGAALRSEQYRDYLDDFHLTGVSVEEPLPKEATSKSLPSPTQSKDRSIYSKDRSIYAKRH